MSYKMKRRGLSLRSRQPARPLNKGSRILLGTLLVLVTLLVARSIQHHSALVSWRNGLAKDGAPIEWPAWNSTWPPLPRPTGKAVNQTWEGPYAFAALNADNLRHIPCYCGCRREGHRSVLDCYVKNFTATGVPIWTDHAFTCETCVNIVREVSLMSQGGMSEREIRAAIDDHHGGFLTKATDTPLPE